MMVMLKTVSTSENGRGTDAGGRLFSCPAATGSVSQNAPNRGPNPGRWLYAWFATASLSPLLCRPAYATTIWTKASEVMKDVYTQILGISTIAAVVTAAVALLMINFGHTDRSTQEARSWLKRIIITWMILNSLGFIMAYITPFFSGGQWTPS